jgi:formylglycine-generating enzyme required for sulfatase activity
MKKIMVFLATVLSIHASNAQNNKPAARLASPTAIEMIQVIGGSFDMGSDSGAVDRRPAHTVKLNNFSIGKYEITQRQWKAVMGTNPSYYENCDECPVTNVSWADVQTYIQKLNEATGKNFRLPTEAEWEFAARGGIRENEMNMKSFAGKKLLQTIAWYEANSKDRVHFVGRKRPNQLDIHDMTGNVEEWCNDWYAKGYFSAKDVTNPKGPETGKSKVVRGGSWNSEKSEVTVIRRAAYVPESKSNYLGFRVACDQ